MPSFLWAAVAPLLIVQPQCSPATFNLATDQVRSAIRAAILEQILSHHEYLGAIGGHVQEYRKQRHLLPIRLLEDVLLTRRQEISQQRRDTGVHVFGHSPATRATSAMRTRVLPLRVMHLQDGAQVDNLPAEKTSLLQTASVFEQIALNDAVLRHPSMGMQAQRNLIQPLPFVLTEKDRAAQCGEFYEKCLRFWVHGDKASG